MAFTSAVRRVSKATAEEILKYLVNNCVTKTI